MWEKKTYLWIVASFWCPIWSPCVFLNFVKPVLNTWWECTIVGMKRCRTPDNCQILAHRKSIYRKYSLLLLFIVPLILRLNENAILKAKRKRESILPIYRFGSCSKIHWFAHCCAFAANSSSHTISRIFCALGWPGTRPWATCDRSRLCASRISDFWAAVIPVATMAKKREKEIEFELV